jgi:outer membrane biosynthesis protein TonB
MTKSQRSFGSKVRIATAGLVLGLAASLVSTTAAHALPNGDNTCIRNPQLCDGGGVVVDPPPPPKPPKCRVILCEGDGPVLDPVNDPVSEPQPEPEPEPEPTQEPEDPKTEEPKTEEPKQEETQNDSPADNGQNNGNGSGTGRTRTAGNNGQVQQVEAAPETTDEVQTVAQNQAAEAESGLSQFAKLFIIFTLAGAGFGLVTYLRQRKHS